MKLKRARRWSKKSKNRRKITILMGRSKFMNDMSGIFLILCLLIYDDEP